MSRVCSVTSVRDVALDLILSTAEAAIVCLEHLDDVRVLRTHLTELQKQSKLLGWAITGLDETIEQIRSAVARFDDAAYDELDAWSRRWALAQGYTAAPVPADVLVAPLGGMRWVEAEFRRWATTQTPDYDSYPERAVLYEYWEAKADSLSERAPVILACRAESTTRALGSTAMRWFGAGESARLVPERAAAMLRELLSYSRVDMAWAMCDSDLACEIATEMLRNGLPVKQAAVVAAATLR